MNGHEAREIMEDRLDGELADEEQHALECHLAECDECRRQFDEMSAVDRWARSLKPASPGPDFTERVMARVAAEPPVIETSPRGIELIIAAVAAMVILPAVLGGSEIVYDWLVAATGAIGEMFSAIAADFAAMGNDVLTAIPAAWASLENVQSSPNAIWMGLTAATAALLMIVFNFFQARKVEKS